MKRFLQLTLIIALAVGAVSCKKDEIINTVKEAPKDAPTVKELPPMQKITLSASSTKPGLRIAYDASRGTDVTDDNTLWQEGDEIAVYNVGVSGKPKRFVLVDGAGTSYGTFVGNIEPTGNYYGVYPYSAVRDQVLDGSSISFILPANQSYAEGSFGRDAAVFAATSTTEGDDVVLHFEPLLGYLSLSLKTPSNTTRDASSIVGGHSVGSIVLHENSLGGVALSGNATIDMSSADYEHNIPPTLSVAPGGSLDVTLNCGGVQLNSTTPVEFIIAVPAGAFSKGLCATVNDISGNKIMSLATAVSNTITANCITQLPEQDVYNMEDIVGNRYPVSKIGPNIWMGENLRVKKYDNCSEWTNKDFEITRIITDIPDYKYYEPCYQDARDTEYWLRKSGTPEQIHLDNQYLEDPSDWAAVSANKDKMGFSYNWTAVMGISGKDNVKDYTEPRQGICPDGWHVPSVVEYYYLLSEYVVTNLEYSGYSVYESGKFLKTVDGWSSHKSNGVVGTDDFGFSLLPAGSYSRTTINHFALIGSESNLWTSSYSDEEDAYQYFSTNSTNDFSYAWPAPVVSYRSVRCLKNYE
ncbi:MAG: FISUMP domain-containing protein [Bacteroidales bacterium]|nr:FISUMP domain-containing protein [Bacteroidales bacterium]